MDWRKTGTVHHHKWPRRLRVAVILGLTILTWTLILGVGLRVKRVLTS